MRLIYTFFLYLCTPFLIIRLYWKARRLPAYKNRIRERFFLQKSRLPKIDVWIHAVSLGEVNAASLLIDRLLDKKLQVMITTMTPTGSERVKTRFGSNVHHQYLPYDLPRIVRRFLNAMDPKLGIIMETELWPNLLHAAKQRNMPLLLANARLSDKAFKQYYQFRFLFKTVLNNFTEILAQSTEDADRFIALGADSEIISIPGNMKFDINSQAFAQEQFQEFKSRWGENRTVVMAASTHDNEEAQILQVLPRLQAAIKDVLLIIAPRHPERFQAVYQLCSEMNFSVCLKSQFSSPNQEVDVFLLNTLGELQGFYSLSDYAFVGGSLIAVGGHNVLEPIAAHVPVFTGPYINNAKSICRDLEAANAIQIVKNAEELISAIIFLHNDPKQRSNQIHSANTVLKNNKGSVQRHLIRIEAILNGSIEKL